MERQYEEDIKEFGGPPEEVSETEELPIESASEEAEGSHPEETDENEEHAERLPKKRSSDKTRINQIQREKYQALDELNRTKSELDRVKKMAELTAEAASRHYDDNVLQRLERARQLKAQAIESGDVQAQVDADMEMASATNEFQNLNAWKAQQSFKIQNDYVPQYDDSAQKDYEAQKWVTENSWIHPDSEDYNEDLAEQVSLYCDAMDVNLYRSGYADKIRSPEYFHQINKHIYELTKKGYGQKRELAMRSTRSPVSPVRNSYSHQGERQGREIRLTNEEKDLARHLKVPEKVYLAKKIENERNEAIKRGQRR
jgi:hypothetical protein